MVQGNVFKNTVSTADLQDFNVIILVFTLSLNHGESHLTSVYHPIQEEMYFPTMLPSVYMN